MMNLLTDESIDMLMQKNNRSVFKLGSLAIIISIMLSACGGGGSGSPVGGGNTTVAVPDSGQTSCYYDYTSDGIYNPAAFTCLSPGSAWGPDGQDGYYSINTMSFTDNGDGTVIDNVTGLVWQKCSLGKSGSDCSGGSISSNTWSAAKVQCANLNLAGTGWRLPTVFELTQLVNYGRSYATIDQTVFPGTGASSYWTSTVHANQSSWAWYVNFAQGNTYAHEQSQTYYVRCVRG
ncbi:MAG TPA: DUF1566 domain-containing protein [Gammaproteobacteria bacterium]